MRIQKKSYAFTSKTSSKLVIRLAESVPSPFHRVLVGSRNHRPSFLVVRIHSGFHGFSGLQLPPVAVVGNENTHWLFEVKANSKSILYQIDYLTSCECTEAKWWGQSLQWWGLPESQAERISQGLLDLLFQKPPSKKQVSNPSLVH